MKGFLNDQLKESKIENWKINLLKFWIFKPDIFYIAGGSLYHKIAEQTELFSEEVYTNSYIKGDNNSRSHKMYKNNRAKQHLKPNCFEKKKKKIFDKDRQQQQTHGPDSLNCLPSPI